MDRDGVEVVGRRGRYSRSRGVYSDNACILAGNGEVQVE